MSFDTLGLTPTLCARIGALGYTNPTPVQAAAIPLVLTGADVIARAQTGTGKTAAFGLPMIERLTAPGARSANGRPRALVLVPTRELAMQVHQSLASYGSHARLRVTHIFGGVSMAPQVKALRQGTDIVVATPGRLIDHLDQRTIDLSGIQVLTLDEADRMLDMGFLPPLRRILRALPTRRQTLLFSATLPPAVAELSKEFTRDAKHVDVSPADPVASTVTHLVHAVDQERKSALLRHVLTERTGSQALVFCKTKRGADRIAKQLDGNGFRATAIHGNKAQGARNRSLADFKSGRVSVLVATDIAARGLDIAQLPLVVNYDLPMVAEDYVHRVGRTGRAGATGHAISLVTPADRLLLRDIQRILPAPLEQVAVAGFEPGPASHASQPAGDERRREPAGAPRGGRPGQRRWSAGRPSSQRRSSFSRAAR